MDWSSFFSTIFGAIVGGGIAYFGQLKTIDEARKERDVGRLQLRQAQACSLLFKILKMQSDARGTRLVFRQAFDAAANQGDADAEPWQVVLPIANVSDEIVFTSEEKALLLLMKKDDLLNLVLPLEGTHKSLIDTLTRFNTEQKLLAESLPPPTRERGGGAFSVTMTEGQRIALRPRMVSVNTLYDGTKNLADQVFEQCASASELIRKVLEAELSLPIKFTAVPDPEPARRLDPP